MRPPPSAEAIARAACSTRSVPLQQHAVDRWIQSKACRDGTLDPGWVARWVGRDQLVHPATRLGEHLGGSLAAHAQVGDLQIRHDADGVGDAPFDQSFAGRPTRQVLVRAERGRGPHLAATAPRSSGLRSTGSRPTERAQSRRRAGRGPGWRWPGPAGTRLDRRVDGALHLAPVRERCGSRGRDRSRRPLLVRRSGSQPSRPTRRCVER